MYTIISRFLKKSRVKYILIVFDMLQRYHHAAELNDAMVLTPGQVLMITSWSMLFLDVKYL